MRFLRLCRLIIVKAVITLGIALTTLAALLVPAEYHLAVAGASIAVNALWIWET